MSHFLTLVLVEATNADPLEQAERLMMPFCGDRPDAKCDGFTVGGRYDGAIWGKQQHHNLTPAEFQRRYGLDVVSPGDNMRPVPELLPGLLPGAIITPDGRWFEWVVPRRGDGRQEWTVTVRAMLEQHRDHVAVAIDCHC